MFEETKTCSDLPYDDLSTYVTLVFEAMRDNEITCELEELCSKGYGNSLKEVDFYFNRHFDKCYLCKETFESELEVDLELWDTKKSEDFWIAFGLTKEQIVAKKQLVPLYVKFSIEHIEMGEEASELRDYIRSKCMGQAQQPNKKYEQHIMNCDFCKEFFGIAKVAWGVAWKR